ncbi:tartrate dehydrogenase/decarboxylase / D-malate dehydrogenase [Salinibacillus kushneri]|uniref:Tartrate dehydrogenase/decarboxylase / D-malate dehydrogenase n=1 Tax=Salinibacillus kushneri TaxID=237682 RepID=A0A1H9ZC07_9BACI|nr:isocitrate/isopropylmalate family dehydrogenase [Salinibacillus kushneri]SES79157.1 tartrate dehydrogenase/decarboxylase / D-malate dehydrogenase [Salinibacillus kushneri]
MYKLAVIPGDGVGKEVMEEALKVIRVINDRESITLDYEIFDWGSEYYLKYGRMMPDNGQAILQEYDAILFGAIGDSRVPDEVTIWEFIMPIRKNFKQYVNLRPVKLLKGIESPLRLSEEIDFVIFRENTEGEYSDVGGLMFQGDQRELAVQNTIMTRQGIAQLTEYVMKYAKAHHYTKVTNATKSNAITHVMGFWDQVVEEIFANEVLAYEKIYIDALAAYFVERPERFQVVMASNLFGDILSDLGSAIVGGLGMAPSGNINPEKEFPSMFEPVHGSAPDIAGKGIANPLAQIWSVALMLDHLGRKDLHDHVVFAIEQLLLENKTLTPDIGGNATTKDVGNAFIKKLYR